MIHASMHPKNIMKMPTICTLLVLTKSSNSSSDDHDNNPTTTNLVISGFHCSVDEICILLQLYAP
jgi:hypothetical protein